MNLQAVWLTSTIVNCAVLLTLSTDAAGRYPWLTVLTKMGLAAHVTAYHTLSGKSSAADVPLQSARANEEGLVMQDNKRASSKPELIEVHEQKGPSEKHATQSKTIL